ncbi:MAG: tubulin-like doman-containing protein [Chloroflexales bacterium]|nr:tubulin-like doman-containing protein [Chloroflexales bacterium]
MRQRICREPLPKISMPPPVTGPQPAVEPERNAPPTLAPSVTAHRPALIVGLGSAGRWTMTYLKQILRDSGDLSSVRLLACDMLSDGGEQEVLPLTLAAPDVFSGETTIVLDEQELHWIYNRSTMLQNNLRQDPAAYPRLHAWSALLTGNAPHIIARLAFLADLSAVAARLREALGQFHQRQSLDVYMIVGLGEAIGAGALLDFAQLLHLVANDSKQNITLHGIVYLPDVMEAVTSVSQGTRAAAFTVLRSLERAQTNSNQRSYYPSFDLNMLEWEDQNATLEGKLFHTCALMSADRATSSLVNTPPEHGIYPMTADAISAMLTPPAASVLDAHRTQLMPRIDQAQGRLDTALYSSFGTFTYALPHAAIVQEATDLLIDQFITRMLAPGEAADDQAFFTSLRQVRDYDIYAQASYDFHDHWSEDTVLGLLELPEARGALSTHAQEGMLRYVLCEMLHQDKASNDGETINALCNQYVQNILGTMSAPGDALRSVNVNAGEAVLLFRNVLLHHIDTLLNTGTEAGTLTRALACVTAIQKRLASLETTLSSYFQAREAAQPEPMLASVSTNSDQGMPNIRRWITGMPNTVAQEQVLDHQQKRFGYDVELVATRGAVVAVGQMHTITQKLYDELDAFATNLRAEQRVARRRLDAARARRIAQIDLGRVRHEWGMPHTDVTLLRKYLNPKVPLPQANQTRQHVLELRTYVAGEHVASLMNQNPNALLVTTLIERLSWGWDQQSRDPVLRVNLYDGDTVFNVKKGINLRTAIATSYRWVWDLQLPDLFVRGFEGPECLARQLDSELACPSIRYQPTLRDLHERYTFLIVPPAADPTNTFWFEQLIAAQRETSSQHAVHRLVMGGRMRRITYLSTCEAIGALDAGALPAYDNLATNYDSQPLLQTQLAVTLHEALAAHYERNHGIKHRRLHHRLVEVLQHPKRVDLFARALVCGVIGLDQRNLTPRVIVNLEGPAMHELGNGVTHEYSAWLKALRWFTSAADDATMKQIENIVYASISTIPVAAYDRWLDNETLAMLRISSDPAEQDLATLLQAILDPIFTSRWRN